MQSEFYNLTLDQVRYSLVWEDSETVFGALSPQPGDELLVITSAGCNVLTALLYQPAHVTAIDLNPVQNRLLLLKKHIIQQHTYDTLIGIMGFDGKQAVANAAEQISQTLPKNDKSFWTSFFETHPEGLLTAGRLESYITGFYKLLPQQEQQNLKALLNCTTVQEQHRFFMKHLHKSAFKNLFISYFDDEHLSKGRDPKLLKWATETGGENFYKRLLHQLSSVLMRANFYFRFFFFGPAGLPEKILPPCYKKEAWPVLQKNIGKLKIITGEAVDHLLSEEGASVTKASLSNIFEYTSDDEFKKVLTGIAARRQPLKIIFWNLLHNQGSGLLAEANDHKEWKASDKSCFYFKNVLLLNFPSATK